MDLQQIAMTDFVVLQATWSVEKSRQLIEQLRPSHIIVHRRDSQEYYYLLTAQEALHLLATASNAPSVREALDLHESTATPALESDTDAELAPDYCVVLEKGYPVGFFDASVPPQLSRKGSFESTQPDLTVRALVAELPEKVTVHETFVLQVFLSASLSPETGLALPVALPVGTTIDILVQPKRGLALEGSDQGQLVISSEEETKHLEFTLRATALGTGQLWVFASHQGQFLGVLALSVSVLEAPATAELQLRSQEQSLISVSLHQPDLSLLILEQTDAGRPAFTFRLTAQDSTLGLYFKPFGPVHLRVDALQYFQNFFQGIEQLPLNSSTELRLAAKGTTLFTSLFPADLQALVWSLQNRIQTVQVLSEEPWIPWELCKLCGQENERVVEGPFLCEAFTLTRWLPGTPGKPSLQLKNMAIVVPADSGLASAPDERDYLLSLSDGHRKVSPIPATLSKLYEALDSGKYDGWHFCGHGSFSLVNPNSSAMYLENQDPFTPEDLSGRARNLGVSKPLVFLNACQIGRSAMSLTGIGGWAKQFLDAGAGAFIGAYWSIYDKLAYDFAQALYSRLLKGLPIGKAVQEARAVIKSEGDPTWLAYTVFADPLATVRE